MDETFLPDPFEILLVALSPRVPMLDAVYLHGLATAAATMPRPDHAGILADVAPTCRSDRDIESALFDAIEDIADALPVSEHAARVEEGAADEGARWLRGFLRCVAIHEVQWAGIAESPGVVRDALAMCRLLVGEPFGGFSLPAHVDPNALLGSPRFLDDMASRIHGAVLGHHRGEAAGAGAWIDLPVYEADVLGAMDENELASLLLYEGDALPRSVVDECAGRGEPIVPCLRTVIDEWEDADESDAWWSILHAVKILGLVPRPAASAALLEGLLVVHEVDSDMADWLATDWPMLFRDRGADTADGLREIGAQRRLDWFVRSTAVECVLAQSSTAGEASVDSALDWAADLVSDRDDDPDFRYLAALQLLDFPRARHRALLESLADEQAALSRRDRVFGHDEVAEAFDTGDDPDWLHYEDPWRFYDEDAIRERQERRERDRRAHDEALAPGVRDGAHDDDFDDPEYVPMFVREQPKVGRDDPCPCGSGKKFKKCCLVLH